MKASIAVSQIRAALLAAAFFGCGAVPALAAKSPARTPFLLLGSDDPLGTRSLKKGQVIVASKAVYARMAVADEDIYGSDGKVVGASRHLLVAKGDLLFGVVSDNGQITYCALDNKPVGALNGVFVNNADKHSCFIDADGDGRFDASYDLRTKYTNVPIYYDVETGGNALAEPAGYSKVEPRETGRFLTFEAILSRLPAKAAKAEIVVWLKYGKLSDVIGARM